MILNEIGSGPARRGLRGLGEVRLSKRGRQLLDNSAKACGGSAEWRVRKLGEARDALALSQLAPHRITVQHLDLDEALRLIVAMQVPVARRPGGVGDVAVAQGALLALTYRHEAMLLPQPGFVFVQILAPRDVFHAQVGFDGVQPLCLGAQLPAGVRLSEILLMTYGALSMQTVQLDELDPAGVLHPQAARWWRQSADSIPLTRVPFLGGDRAWPT
jgi:hypothetical protein